MPIHCPVRIAKLPCDEMRRLDYQVMAHAFASQNELGRLCDESVYQVDLVARLTAAGLGPVLDELPVEVTHADFKAAYKLDLVVANLAVYELKTVSVLIGEHQAQLLNYLFLTNSSRGKLINFRSKSVESFFVNTSLDDAQRRRMELEDHRWSAATVAGRDLKFLMLELVRDWGLFLEVALYCEAIIHFLGGFDRVVSQVPMFRQGISLGKQEFLLAGPDVAFRVTAYTEHLNDHETHLSRLLRHSPLRALYWINMNHHLVQFVTLTKD